MVDPTKLLKLDECQPFLRVKIHNSDGYKFN